MRLIDPSKTHSRHWGIAQTGQVSEAGSATITEHWDGSQDATVRPAPIRIHVTADAPPNHALVAAVAELEAATKEARLAKQAGHPEWVRYTTKRFNQAKQRLAEVT